MKKLNQHPTLKGSDLSLMWGGEWFKANLEGFLKKEQKIVKYGSIFLFSVPYNSEKVEAEEILNTIFLERLKTFTAFLESQCQTFHMHFEDLLMTAVEKCT